MVGVVPIDAPRRLRSSQVCFLWSSATVRFMAREEWSGPISAGLRPVPPRRQAPPALAAAEGDALDTQHCWWSVRRLRNTGECPGADGPSGPVDHAPAASS